VTAARVAEPVDAVIIGAGAAGCLYAAKLAMAGHAVLTLEAGPAWDTGDLVSSHIWSRRIRWAGPHVASAGEHPYNFGFNNGWGFGGAANHHYGVWPRLHPEDFEVHSAYGRGLDWPVDYDTLRPWYDRVQSEIGLAGDAEAEIWRPGGEPYPMPPLPRFRQGEIIARGFAALDQPVAPAPVAINTVPRGGRAACIYDGWCDAGCPTGALANPLVTYKRDAVAAGARFEANARALRLQAAARDRAGAVEYLDANGELVAQPARLVVLAAAVAFNPALLLNSVSQWHPQGIGNAHGLVGRYFMTHPAAFITGLFEEETEPHAGITHGNLLCQARYDKQSEPQAFGSRQWLIGSVMKPNDVTGIAMSRPDLMGPALEPFLRRAVKHIGAMIGMAEELPAAENRVELAAEADAHGFRQPRIVHRFSDNTQALVAAMIEEGKAVFRAAGCEQPTHTRITTHLLGGTIMGTAPENSVTDEHGRVHGMRNVFVAGSGLYPTAGAVNPTFTLHALGLRACDHLVARWSDYAA